MKNKIDVLRVKNKIDPRAPTYVVHIVGDVSEKRAIVKMPFAPFPGLWVCVPFLKNDYAKIEGVYWQENKNYFEVFVDA